VGRREGSVVPREIVVNPIADNPAAELISARRVSDAVDSGVERSFIVRELLKRAHAAGCGYNRNEIARLHLAVDEVFQRGTDARKFGRRLAEIVSHQHDGSANVLRVKVLRERHVGFNRQGS
jgi:hypothetical protein